MRRHLIDVVYLIGAVAVIVIVDGVAPTAVTDCRCCFFMSIVRIWGRIIVAAADTEAVDAPSCFSPLIRL